MVIFMSSLGNKKVIAENINYYLMLTEKTQKELCKDLGFKETTVSDWINAKTYPRIDKIEMMANYFGIQKSNLIEKRSATDKSVFSIYSYTYIPESISAGALENINAINDLPQIDMPDAILGKYAHDKDIVFMTVNGESMNRVISNHSVIAVKTNIDRNLLSNGDIVIASNNGGYTVKRFINDERNQRIILRPDSTDESFSDIIIPYDIADDLRIFGKVVVYSFIL